MPTVPALRLLKLEDLGFKARLFYVARTCLKNKGTKENRSQARWQMLTR